MIPIIRSLTELMVITESRHVQKKECKKDEIKYSMLDSGQRKRYMKSIKNNEIDLPNIPKTDRNKWRKKKDAVSRFFDDLDYNDQIQSSFDLTLLARQSMSNQQDVA